MKKIQFVLQLLLMIAASGIITASDPLSPPQPTQTTDNQPGIVAATGVPDTATASTPVDVVRLAWFYKPPDSTEMDLVAGKADFFILTYKDEKERDEFKAKGITAPFSQYLLFSEIKDPGGCDKSPTGNQVAYKIGDFCQISEVHPDWFLLDSNGNRIGNGETYFMDPGNEGYRAFWLERARELQETYGWDNIFLDNVEASRAKMVDDDEPLENYPDDESYRRAVEGFLAYIRQNYFQPQGKPMYANIVSVDEDHVWDAYLQYLEGAMIESFATDWDNGYPSHKDWERQMEQAVEALASGKTLILVAQGKQENLDLQNFAFASYLLISNGNAYFRYTHSENYREWWLYENYNLDPGTPLGERYKYKGGWRRDFSNGYVIVKPQNKQAEIVINP